MKELQVIQSKIHAPKSEVNQYGKYKYRKAEQILEAAKPLCDEQKCTLVVTDDMVLVGNYVYVKATAKITNEKGESEQAVGWAREADSLAGMSAGQVTGATSSYARKYALCGLFAIDDTKDLDDPDVTNPKGRTHGEATLEQAVTEMKQCKNVQEVTACWKKYPQFKQEQEFIDVCTDMGNSFKS